MFGDEDLIAVLFWKHVAGVETHAESRYVRAEFLDRRDKFVATALTAECGIGDVGAVAVGIAEVLSIGGYSVQFVRWHIVAHPVSSVVREPQFARFRVPIEADGVANASRYDAEGAIGIQSSNRRVRIAAIADVARRADGYVQQVVGAKADEFPAVRTICGESVVDDFRLRRVVEL